MSRLYELFVSMTSEKSLYLGSQKGDEFEDRLNTKLHQLGFSRLIKDEINTSDFKLLKELVLYKEQDYHIKNPFDCYKNHFIVQPYGTQNYPDFLIVDNKRVISIEVKFSKTKVGKPVWNSGLPRPNGIYVFGSFQKKDLTYFLGRDVVSLSEVQKLHDFFDRGLKEYQNIFNKDEMGNQKYGFQAYIRKAFQQQKNYNRDAIIDFFQNDNRKHLENSVINFLKYHK